MSMLPRSDGWARMSIRLTNTMMPVACVAWILLVGFAGTEETCHFPQFLQSSPAEGALKPWTTRMWWLYLRHAPKWAEKQDIYVKNGQMWRHREQNLQACERSPRRVFHKTSFGHCSERQLVYNRTCIHEEGYNIFRVIQYNADRTHRFTCMKFVKRSNNVVQVYEGPVKDTNDVDLCDPAGLIQDEWPWTAPWNDEPSFCPVSGGFTFRTIRRLTNEDLCEEEWRRSQLEIECVKGDGMDFIAPKDSNCNPFLKQGDWKRLLCWTGWEHEEYIFIIASDVGSQPRYCLLLLYNTRLRRQKWCAVIYVGVKRFPRVQEGEFSVLVYFSVICPTENDGKPTHGIEYYELRMSKKDQHACKDENASKCGELMTSSEMCAKDKIYAPHCPKTCGRCSKNTVSDINGRRCWLDPALYGDWFLFDNRSTVEVTINRERAIFSHLGTFQCLDTDLNGRRYKMASIFSNGCAPRYTCMEFSRRNNNVLQYRISPSERIELKMSDLCTFRNDLHPLSDFYRSEYFKNLILVNNLWPSYCGFQSTIPFNGTINGHQCSGTVSDWDEDSCSMVGTLSIKSDTCKELLLPIVSEEEENIAGPCSPTPFGEHAPDEDEWQPQYQCVAYINDDAVPLQQLLLTRSLDGRNMFNCWVITSYVGGGHWPWRVLYQMPTPQCSLVMEVDMTVGSSTAALYLDDRSRRKVCRPEVARQQMTQSDVTKSTASDQGYIVSNENQSSNEATDIRVQTRSPGITASHYPTEYINTDPPVWSLYGNSSGGPGLFCARNILTVFLSVLHLFFQTHLFR